MELVDVLNQRKELIKEVCERDNVPEGMYRLSIHIWIMNDKNEILIQQRSSNRTMFPNMWSNTGGAALKGEQSLDTVLRELKEELNIIPDINNLSLIASYKRKKDYVDVWLLKENINKEKIVLQESEVQDIKWTNINDIDKMISQKKFIKSSYDYLTLYLQNEY